MKLRRRYVALALMLGLLLVAAAPHAALAHGGSRVFIGDVGPYHIEVSNLVYSAGDHDIADYTVSLLIAGDRRPVDGATVSVSVQLPSGEVKQFQAKGSTQLYEALIPVSEKGTWRLTVQVQAPDGVTTFQHSLSIGASGFPIEWIVLAVVLPALVFSAAWRSRRRRKQVRQPAPGHGAPRNT